jgi:hypothetical protein
MAETSGLPRWGPYREWTSRSLSEPAGRPRHGGLAATGTFTGRKLQICILPGDCIKSTAECGQNGKARPRQARRQPKSEPSQGRTPIPEHRLACSRHAGVAATHKTKRAGSLRPFWTSYDAENRYLDLGVRLIRLSELANGPVCHLLSESLTVDGPSPRLPVIWVLARNSLLSVEPVRTRCRRSLRREESRPSHRREMRRRQTCVTRSN